MPIRNLAEHPLAWVTVRELAEYWLVSQRHVRQQVAAGVLEGIRLGPRLHRISVASALALERGLTRGGQRAAPGPYPASAND